MHPALLLVLAPVHAGQADTTPPPHHAHEDSEAVGRLSASAAIEPLGGFVENRGQWPEAVRFFARAGAVEATVLCDGFVLKPIAPIDEYGFAERRTEPVFVRFAEGACAADVVGLDPGPTKHHFIHANGSASGALGFEQVRFESVWPGVDVVLRRQVDRFAYDIHVGAGAPLDVVALEFRGASEACIQPDGDLTFDTAEGELRQRFGPAWQTSKSGVHGAVTPGFEILAPASDGAPTVGFVAADRSADCALVIDPTLEFSTYAGGAGPEQLPGVTANDSGHVFVACRAGSGSPVTPGAFETQYSGVVDAWIGMLSADGSHLAWSTYLGGSDGDLPEAIAYAPDGTLVVFGTTFSDDFPTTPNALHPLESGIADAFLTRLAPDGASLVYSTYLGSKLSEPVHGALACLPSNEIVVAWSPASDDVPNLPPLGYDATWDEDDYLITRLAADGSAVLAATYLQAGRILDLAVDPAGNVYVAGDTTSAPSPTTPNAHQTDYGGTSGNGYAASLTPDLSELRYGTFLGGSDGSSDVWGIAVDAAGCLYFAMQTSSENSPTTPGAFQPAGAQNGLGHVAKLLPHGTGLAWGSYIGTPVLNGGGYPSNVVVDAAGNATFSGWANTPGWPTTDDAFQKDYVGPFPSADGATSHFDAVGESLLYSTWFGQAGSERIMGSVHAGPGRVALVLQAGAGLPTTPGAYDETHNGSTDCGVAVFDLGLAPWRILGPGSKGSIETPNLVGLGENTPGAPTRLALRGALPSVPVFFVAGDSAWNLPILGGTLVPNPQVTVTRFTNALGWRDLEFPWPALAPGAELYLQAWCYDPGAPGLFSSSNALKGLAQ